METHDQDSKNHIFMMSSENIFEEKEVCVSQATTEMCCNSLSRSNIKIKGIIIIQPFGEEFYVNVLSN